MLPCSLIITLQKSSLKSFFLLKNFFLCSKSLHSERRGTCKGRKTYRDLCQPFPFLLFALLRGRLPTGELCFPETLCCLFSEALYFLRGLGFYLKFVSDDLLAHINYIQWWDTLWHFHLSTRDKYIYTLYFNPISLLFSFLPRPTNLLPLSNHFSECLEGQVVENASVPFVKLVSTVAVDLMIRWRWVGCLVGEWSLRGQCCIMGYVLYAEWGGGVGDLHISPPKS